MNTNRRTFYVSVLLLWFAGCPSWGSECRLSNRGQDYTGHVAHTSGGLECQDWVSFYPHSHNFNDGSLFPENSIWDVKNYCRNPDGNLGGPWCYTTDWDVTWDYCDVPMCGYEMFEVAETCKLSPSGVEYSGTVSTTKSGKTCQRWDLQSPHQHDHTHPFFFPGILSLDQASNYCRNPDTHTGGPWCYTTDESVRWEECEISCCLPDCADPSEYEKLVQSLFIASLASRPSPAPGQISYDGPSVPQVDSGCWRVRPGYMLFTCASETVLGLLPEECLQRCEAETRFSCLSVNYPIHTRECQLNANTAAKATYEFYPHPKNIYYERLANCQ